MLISIKCNGIQLFSGSDMPRMVFFLLINVKMLTIVSILTFRSRKKPCSAEFFITSGPDPPPHVESLPFAYV